MSKRRRTTSPEAIEQTITICLQSYLNGVMTEKHLSRILKQQLHGNAAKLSVRIIELLPDFEQLLTLITELESPYLIDKKIRKYTIQKLVYNLHDALTD